MKKLFNTSKYDWIFPLILFIILITSLICLLVFYIPNQNEKTIYKILVICIMSIFILASFIVFLFAFQYVILNKNGIEFRCLVHSYAFIKWSEIDKISLVKLNTSSSAVGMKYFHYFMEIQTKDKQSRFNKIIYNKKKFKIYIGIPCNI